MGGGIAIVTSSSDEKLTTVQALGADFGINYCADPVWDEAVLRITGGSGADLVLDIGGADTLARSINAARQGGQVSIIGARGAVGEPSSIPVEQTLIRKLTLKGITVSRCSVSPEETKKSGRGMTPSRTIRAS